MTVIKNFSSSVLIITLTIILSACNATTPQDPEELSLVSPRFGHAAINDGNKIFVFAGSNKTGFRSDVEIIDPELGAIKVLHNKLIPRRYFSAVWDGNHSVYIIGGVSKQRNKFRFEKRVEIFNTITHEVSFAPPLPIPTRLNSAVLLSGRIYVLGGSYPSRPRLKPSAKMNVFNISENRWLQAAYMPTAKETRAVVRGDKIYAVGGYNQSHSMNVFEMYDPKLDAWQTLPAMPENISAHSLTLVKDTLYVFGNYHDLKSTYAYNFINEQWKKVELGYQASRHNATTTTLDSTTYVIGGTTGGKRPFLDYIQKFKL